MVFYLIAEPFRTYIAVSVRPVSFKKALLKDDLEPQEPLKLKQQYYKRSISTRKLAPERLQDYSI
nr:unnamed protein product [Callosobruchus chinensis]